METQHECVCVCVCVYYTAVLSVSMATGSDTPPNQTLVCQACANLSRCQCTKECVHVCFHPSKLCFLKTSSIRSVSSQLMFFEMRAEGRNFSTVESAERGRVALGKVIHTHTHTHTHTHRHTNTHRAVILAGVQHLTLSLTQGDHDQIYINEASACLIC